MSPTSTPSPTPNLLPRSNSFGMTRGDILIVALVPIIFLVFILIFRYTHLLGRLCSSDDPPTFTPQQQHTLVVINNINTTINPDIDIEIGPTSTAAPVPAVSIRTRTSIETTLPGYEAALAAGLAEGVPPTYEELQAENDGTAKKEEKWWKMLFRQRPKKARVPKRCSNELWHDFP